MRLEGVIGSVVVDGLGLVDEVVTDAEKKVSEKAGLVDAEELFRIDVGEDQVAAGDYFGEQSLGLFVGPDPPADEEDTVEAQSGGIFRGIDVEAVAFAQAAPLAYIGSDGGDQDFHDF